MANIPLFDELKKRLDNSSIPNSNYGYWHFDRDTAGMSLDNPYLQQMRNASNKTDYKRILTSAVDWEASNQAYQRQLADQRALRDEDRAYNSVGAELARQRAAGLNPDVQGVQSSSGSGSGSVSAPDMDLPSTDTLSTPVETANTAFNGISAAASLISAVSGSFADITSSVLAIKNFGTEKGLKESQTRVANETADAISTQNDILSKTSDAQIVSSMLSSASEIASLYPFSTDPKTGVAVVPELSEVESFVENFGLGNPSSMSNLVHKMLKNPEYKANFDKAVEERAKNEADAINRGLDFYNQLSETSSKVELIMADTEYYRSSMSNRLNRLLSESNYIDQSASNIVKSEDVDSMVLDNLSTELALEAEYLKRDFEAWNNSLIMLSQTRKSIQEKIDKLKAKPGYSKSMIWRQEVDWLTSQLLYVDSRGSQSLGEIKTVYSEVLRRMQAIDTAVSPFGQPFSNWENEKDEYFNLYNYTWSNYYNDPATINGVIGPVINGVVDFLGIAVDYKMKTRPVHRSNTRTPQRGGGYTEYTKTW